jgi:hypothetical protein
MTTIPASKDNWPDYDYYESYSEGPAPKKSPAYDDDDDDDVTTNTFFDDSDFTSLRPVWCQCYKTFYVRNLLIFVIS